MSFERLIGNNNVKKILNSILEKNTISHSYIFSGIEGIGKYLFAKEFAKNILCENGDACNNCKSCIEFNSDNNPDYNCIDIIDGNTIKIDQIRQMQEKIIEKPIISRKKVYIINNANAMVKQAQNCLLKTLEEPPEYVVIILITNNDDDLLTTIKSRCAKIVFNPIENDELKSYLESKNMKYTEELLDLYEGSIKRVYDIEDKKDIYININKIFKNIENIDILDVLGKAECLYKQKDNIYEILDYINVIFFKKIKYNKNYIVYINYVEETKKSLHANANYDMSIDKLILNIWKG